MLKQKKFNESCQVLKDALKDCKASEDQRDILIELFYVNGQAGNYIFVRMYR